MWQAADGSLRAKSDDRPMKFVDRRDAGCKLAHYLLPFVDEDPVVIALPAGGVPVAYEVARVLDAPLDFLGRERYRNSYPAIDVRGRTVIAVDDHLASGVAILTAVHVLRARGAARIIVAVPVGARESVALVSKEAHAVVCPIIPY